MTAPTHHGTSLSVLSPDQIRAIHHASLRVLSETGVRMPLTPERQAQARELGLLVESETHRVRFPPALVEEALTRAPSSYTLCARNREDEVLLDRMPFEAWQEAGRPTALDRARERVREILEAHQPEPLPCEAQIREIISTRARSRE